MELSEIQKRFTFHSANDEETKNAHEEVRRQCKSLAIALNLLVPEGREKTLVMTKLEEVMFWANAGIARANELKTD